MESLGRIGRPLLLLVLLIAGAGLIWHVGYNLRGHDAAPRRATPARATDSKMAGPTGVSINQARVPELNAKKLSPKESKPLPKSEFGGAAPAKSPDSRKQLPSLTSNGRGRFMPAAPILFNTGLSALRKTSIAPLDKLAAMLKENPDIQLDIIGYTDNLGIESVNLKLSAERAAAVKDYLASQGIAASRLKSEGMGSRDPIASNETQMGRQANRRIEFWISGSK